MQKVREKFFIKNSNEYPWYQQIQASKVKYAGGKIVHHSDLRVQATQKDKSIKEKAKSKKGNKELVHGM